MLEKYMRREVVKILKPLGGFPVENPCLPGTPDVNCHVGWIELKSIKKWPKNDNLVVKIEHFTTQQKLFLRNRWRENKDAFILIKIDRDWFLFTGAWSKEIGSEFNRQDYLDYSIGHWRTLSELKENLVKSMRQITKD